MSDRKRYPETMSSTVSAEHSQKGKKSRKKFSRYPRQNVLDEIPVQDDMHQMASVSSPKPNPQRESDIVSNFVDFPHLVRNENEVRTSRFQKSWRTYASGRGNGNDFDKTFPKLPHVGTSKQRKDSLFGKRNEPESTSSIQENPVVDIADNGSTSKMEGRVKPDNYNMKHPQPKDKMQPQRNPTKKKRADPVLINLNEILEVNKAHKKTKQQKTFKCKSHRFDNKERLSGNTLDSSNPRRNRGKHREIKKRKLTNLKIVILKERIIKQKLRENHVDERSGNSYTSLIESIDFKEEIVKYLKDLDERKIKMKKRKKRRGNRNTQTGVKMERVEGKFSEDRDKHRQVGCSRDRSSLEKSNFESVSNTKGQKEAMISCKVREYCENIITPGLNSAVTELIRDVVSLQDKLFAKDPVKARAKRRHVSGIREVKKFLNLKKVKMIIIPPNLEMLHMKGSVFDLISELKEMANTQNVPYVFALNRYKLGKCTRKNVPVGAFAILNYEGLEGRFKNVLLHLQEARQQFADIMSKTAPKFKGENIGEDKQETGDAMLKTVIRDDPTTSKEEDPGEEDFSQRISSFLASLRELSTNK